MKKCTKCHQLKEFSNFWKNSKNRSGLQSKCKPCHSLAMDKNVAKNTKLIRIYGIDLEQYQELSNLWDNKCAICGQHETVLDGRTKQPRSLAVDHDHKLGHIRGVLCSKCNRGIGMFNDNTELLENAMSYLNAYKDAVKEQNASHK